MMSRIRPRTSPPTWAKRLRCDGGRAGSVVEALLDTAAENLIRRVDPVHGGLSRGRPKFPNPVNLEYLLRYHSATGSDQALQVVLFTLRKMAQGGMYDQLGGGFHRYSVDERWLVPHFEKMLYDNAQLARVPPRVAALR